VEPTCCETYACRAAAAAPPQLRTWQIRVWPRLDDASSNAPRDEPMPQTTHIIYQLNKLMCVLVDHVLIHGSDSVIRFVTLVVVLVLLIKVLVPPEIAGRVGSADVALWVLRRWRRLRVAIGCLTVESNATSSRPHHLKGAPRIVPCCVGLSFGSGSPQLKVFAVGRASFGRPSCPRRTSGG
jgi:hypothetical protein